MTASPIAPIMWIGGDLDVDGDVDVIAFRNPEYQVFRRTPGGALPPEAVQLGGPAESLVDIDGDGDLDGVCCGGSGGPTPTWPQLNFESRFQLSHNDGTGSFAPAWSAAGVGSESMAGAADMDGDGDVDLVAGRCIYYGRGPWVEDPMPEAGGDDSMSWFRPQLLRDFDRDGDLDIVNGQKLINDGHGSFKSGSGFPPPPGAQFVDFFNIDLDNDGAVEQVVHRSGASVSEASLLQNNGGGHLVYSGQVPGAGGMSGVFPSWTFAYDANVVADLDSDGDEDVLAYTLTGTQVYWNNNGTFVAGSSLAASPLAVADFDGDGRPDIFARSGSSSRLYLGTSTLGQFIHVWTGPAATNVPTSRLVADINDDGRLDFVAPGPAGISLFVNMIPARRPLWLRTSRVAGSSPDVLVAQRRALGGDRGRF